ncbi:hypothetical protein ACTA71_009337 [Dictyostelium dimigraforme]
MHEIVAPESKIGIAIIAAERIYSETFTIGMFLKYFVFKLEPSDFPLVHEPPITIQRINQENEDGTLIVPLVVIGTMVSTNLSEKERHQPSIRLQYSRNNRINFEWKSAFFKFYFLFFFKFQQKCPDSSVGRAQGF